MTIPVIATINEVEYPINGVDIKYSICKSMGAASFEMNISHRDTILTFNDVEISVEGEAIFTGVVESITTGRFPDRMEIQASCIYIKAERTWFAEELTSTGQTVRSWAGRFFSKAQITNKSVSIPSTTVYPGHSWGFQTCHEALLNLAQIVNARIYPDRHGVIHFTPPKNGGPDHIIEYYSECNKFYTNRATRNKVTVFGSIGISATRFGGNESLPPGPPRHLAISSSLIQTVGTAEAVVNQILSTFLGPMEIYTYVVEGRSTMSLNDVVETPDDTGIITSLIHKIDTRGFTTEVTIGEICPSFFGMDIITESIPGTYASLTAGGVWKLGVGEVTWANISGDSLPNKTVPAIHWDGIFLWAITENNIYRGRGEHFWTTCSILESFQFGTTLILSSNFILKDIITDIDDNVYVVAFDSILTRTVILVSQNNYLFDRLIIL